VVAKLRIAQLIIPVLAEVQWQEFVDLEMERL
jgi:hypothetical protein